MVKSSIFNKKWSGYPKPLIWNEICGDPHCAHFCLLNSILLQEKQREETSSHVVGLSCLCTHWVIRHRGQIYLPSIRYAALTGLAACWLCVCMALYYRASLRNGPKCKTRAWSSFQPKKCPLVTAPGALRYHTAKMFIGALRNYQREVRLCGASVMSLRIEVPCERLRDWHSIDSLSITCMEPARHATSMLMNHDKWSVSLSWA